jgi:hypothetical protein
LQQKQAPVITTTKQATLEYPVRKKVRFNDEYNITSAPEDKPVNRRRSDAAWSN